MKPQDEYVALLPLLADYWDKPLSELPEELRARVSPQVRKSFAGYRPKYDASGNLERNAEGYSPVWEEVYTEHHVGDFMLDWDALMPVQRQEYVRQIDAKHDPARRWLWYDVSMDARTWWGLQDIKPRDAAMLLCRINPLSCKHEDPESIYVDDVKSSPKRYLRLLLTFEDVAIAAPQARTLSKWLGIARDKKLEYHQWIDEYERGINLEESAPGAPEKDEQAIAQTEPQGLPGTGKVEAVLPTQSEESKPWFTPDPKDPTPAQPWYTPARYFARQLVNDDSTLLTKRNLLAIKVSQSLANVHIFKRGKIKPFDPNTILKAFSNVSLG